MAINPQDVQSKLDAATKALSSTTSSYKQMVSKYGSDWKTWPPTSNWYIALNNIEAARSEVGQFTQSKLFASFTYK